MHKSKKFNPVVRRISFGEYDASRIYEWRLAMNQGMKERCCENCELIEKRIAKFIGKEEVEFLKEQVKKYPYFKKRKYAKK